MDDLLQSDGWEWFQRALGRTTHRVDGVLAIEMSLPFGMRYLYAPRSGAATSRQLQASSQFCEYLQRNVSSQKMVFFRGAFARDQLAACSLQLRVPAVMRRLVEPEWTWRTSLAGSDDECLAAMHEKHRYNIRLAERRGVMVRAAPSPHAPPPEEGGKEKGFLPFHGSGGGSRGGGDVEICWKLFQDTAKRQKIATHPRSYYETMLRELSRKPTAASYKPDTDCRLYLAERESESLAAAIVAYHGDTATYLHGGSSYEHRALMAPHLLHWQAMCDAKVAGLKWYDWGGIQSQATSPKPQADRACSLRLSACSSAWSGMTRFKTGFGGEAVHHPPMRDLVFRPGWYRALSFLARLRNWHTTWFAVG